MLKNIEGCSQYSETLLYYKYGPHLLEQHPACTHLPGDSPPPGTAPCLLIPTYQEIAHLPGSILAISAQRLPRTLWASQIILSSSSVQHDFFTSGLRWLCQRSRHCFPSRPFRCLAISVHCLVPYFLTNSMTLKGTSVRDQPLHRLHSSI